MYSPTDVKHWLGVFSVPKQLMDVIMLKLSEIKEQNGDVYSSDVATHIAVPFDTLPEDIQAAYNRLWDAADAERKEREYIQAHSELSAFESRSTTISVKRPQAEVDAERKAMQAGRDARRATRLEREQKLREWAVRNIKLRLRAVKATLPDAELQELDAI